MIPFAFQFSLDAFSQEEMIQVLAVLFILIVFFLILIAREMKGVPLFDFLFPGLKVTEDLKKQYTPFLKRRLLIALLIFTIPLGFGIYQICKIYLSGASF